jgi:ketosteroid isomerase-like protein
MTPSESEIRELLERRTDAKQSKDIDRLLSFYSPDVVYYHVVPIPFDPITFAKSCLLGLLQHVGRRAKKPGRPAGRSVADEDRLGGGE